MKSILVKVKSDRGVVFEIKPNSKMKECHKRIYDNIARRNVRGLFDCYNKPSKIKQVIYQNCLNLFSKLNVNGLNGLYTIPSYNKRVFTFAGIIEHNHKVYFMYITPTKNLLYETC